MTTRPTRLAVPLLAIALGCVAKNDASIEAYAVCGFPEDAEKCDTSGKCDTVLAGRPWVSTRVYGLTNSLDLYVQVNNQLPTNDDPSTGRLNTHDFTIEEYRLSFTSNPAMDLPDFTYRVNQSVPANGSATPLVSLIPSEVMSTIDAFDPVYLGSTPQAIVEVELKIFGHTRDGAEIETAPWVVPVDVWDVSAVDPECLKSTEMVTAVCPHSGQTGTFKCEAR